MYRKISLEVDKSESFTNNLLENFRASLQALHDTCRFRTAVPTGLVFVSGLSHYYLLLSSIKQPISESLSGPGTHVEIPAR